MHADFTEDLDRDIAPRLTSAEDATQVDSIHLTSLMAHQDVVGRSNVDITFFAEHAVDNRCSSNAARRWRETYQGQLHLPPLSSEAKGKSAGVGMAAQQHKTNGRPQTQDSSDARNI